LIKLHRLNEQEFVVNAELIEYVEAQGVQTVVGLATGNRINVKESVEEVVARCIEYRKTVYVGAAYLPEFLKEGSRHVAVDPLRKK
jgi:flagellar protein FlbD